VLRYSAARSNIAARAGGHRSTALVNQQPLEKPLRAQAVLRLPEPLLHKDRPLESGPIAGSSPVSLAHRLRRGLLGCGLLRRGHGRPPGTRSTDPASGNACGCRRASWFSAPQTSQRPQAKRCARITAPRPRRSWVSVKQRICHNGERADSIVPRWAGSNECDRFCAHRAHSTIPNYAVWRGKPRWAHQRPVRRRCPDPPRRCVFRPSAFATRRSRVRGSRRPPTNPLKTERNGRKSRKAVPACPELLARFRAL
jgi:hypothetical protein